MGFSFKISPAVEKKTKPDPSHPPLLPFSVGSKDDSAKPIRQRLLGIGESGQMEIDPEDFIQEKKVVITCKNRLQTSERQRGPPTELDLSKPGLLIPKKRRADEASSSCETSAKSPDAPKASGDTLSAPVNADDVKAAEALKQEATGELQSGGRIAPILTRNSVLLEIRKNATDEGDLLRREVELLPDNELSQYDRVPIEQFGLALLYGMGYDPDKHVSKAAELKRKAYNRSGLGADEHMGRAMKLAKQNENVKQSTLPSGTGNTSAEEDCEAHGKESDGTSDAKRSWLAKGLVVKIANRKHKFFKRKGVIKAVSRPDDGAKGLPTTCSVRLDPVMGGASRNSADEGDVASGITQKDLETVVGSKSRSVQIVGTTGLKEGDRKEHQGIIGKIAEVVNISVSEDRAELRIPSSHDHPCPMLRLVLSLDDVCEYR